MTISELGRYGLSGSCHQRRRTLMRAAFALVEVGLPGVERLRQLEASLAAPLRDAVGPYIASAKSEIDHFEPARTGSPVARILADARPQTAALPTLREYVALDVRPPDV